MNAISVCSLGKKFKLYGSPGKRLLEYLTLGKIPRHTDFWALEDISFDIPAGTTLGILGQNGSGKSTLLSILAGVLEPSAGSFEINGKVSAILELGSGFHPEFSGRDNVYMYGSIVGLTKEQVDARFEEIVRFSELGDFIDQPLRTYSTGMTVRLAFSVAVNVDADILIVDEALAVGDAIFQHRCFRKIRDMQEAGKTILYVGHDTEAVRNLCTQALLLDGGRIIERGDPNTVVNKYTALIVERERAYTEGCLIEHGKILDEGYETVYDFSRNISEAKIESAKGIQVQPQTIEILSTPRRILFAHAPSKITYTITIGPGSSLAFAIGILPGAWEKIPQGVKFDIDVFSDGMTDSIFSRVLQPKRNIGDRGWHNFLISLDKYSGKTISLIFSTSGSGEDLSFCWSAWGWGKLVRTNRVIDITEKPDETEKIPDTHTTDINNSRLPNQEFRYGNKKAEIIKVEILNQKGEHSLQYNSGDFTIIKVHIFFHQNLMGLVSVGCVIKNRFCEIYGTNNYWKNIPFPENKKDSTIIVKYSMPLKLAQGLYSITPGVAIVHSITEIEYLDIREDCMFFRINKNEHIAGIVDLEATMEFLSE